MKKENTDLTNRLEAIIETAIDGIITIDDRGIIETMNQAAAELFQYQPVEVIGKKINMLMPQPYRAEHDEYIARYQHTKEPRIIGIGREVKGKKKDGTVFPFRLAVSEVILNDRIIFTGVVHDLTDVAEAKGELLKTNEALELKVEERTVELEEVVNHLLGTNKKLEEREAELKAVLAKEKELNELKSRFVSMASHEFRTPLSTILSSASLLSKYQTEAQQDRRDKHIKRIKLAVTNLTGILNDFLSLSKLEEGRLAVQFSEIQLEAICAEVTDSLESILKPGQQIQHKTSGKARPIQSDGQVIKNILFNMLSNALKYSGENQEVVCHVHYDEEFLQLTISDEGIGIPENEQKYLFERFFRASNVDTIQGTGLGLNIVKQYINLLHGEISFESQSNTGTKFFVKLPYL